MIFFQKENPYPYSKGSPHLAEGHNVTHLSDLLSRRIHHAEREEELPREIIC
jgi:hypothetical protein